MLGVLTPRRILQQLDKMFARYLSIPGFWVSKILCVSLRTFIFCSLDLPMKQLFLEAQSGSLVSGVLVSIIFSL